MSETRTSRFFTFDDPQLKTAILELPDIWWSRPYEYAWACSFVEKNNIVLDAGCGLCHPFKYYLCSLCDNVYACDLDERLLLKSEIMMDMFNVFGQQTLDFPVSYLEQPILSIQDISKTSYDDAIFDRIFCISVLEHLPKDVLLKTLLEFKRILNRKGLMIITIDYPYLDLETFNHMLKKAGLSYADRVDFELPYNAVTTALFPEHPGGLYSFRALLKK